MTITISPNQTIGNLENDQDIPPPGSRDKLNRNVFQSYRPPPSMMAHSQKVKNNKSDDASLKSIINKQNQLLEWYSSQIKDCPPSSMKDAITDIISVLPLLNAYDQRLGLAEKAVKSMKKKLDNQSRLECRECNQQLEKSQSLASELDACKEEISKLKIDNNQQEELKWFREENTFLVTQIFEMIAKFEQGSKFNQELQMHCSLLKKSVLNSDKRFQSLLQDYERAVTWINSRKDMVLDYKNCINELGLSNIFESNISNSTILTTKFNLLAKEVADLKRKLQTSREKLDSFKNENSSLIRKFLFEMEKKKTELEEAQTRITELTNLVDRSQTEKKSAEIEASRTVKSNIYMEDHYKSMIRERDDQISDLILKTQNELKMTRDQFNLEKSRLNFEIDELKKSKVALQSEIGHLLRDKRKVELDLESIHRHNEPYRTKLVV